MLFLPMRLFTQPGPLSDIMHLQQNRKLYSITSSARASTVAGSRYLLNLLPKIAHPALRAEDEKTLPNSQRVRRKPMWPGPMR